jgi:hypothetical protein
MMLCCYPINLSIVPYLCPLKLLVAADFSLTCLRRFMSVVGTDENWNFSAVRSPIELKLGGDLWLVSQISVHALVKKNRNQTL